MVEGVFPLMGVKALILLWDIGNEGVSAVNHQPVGHASGLKESALP
jgi:hypothetical protein